MVVLMFILCRIFTLDKLTINNDVHYQSKVWAQLLIQGFCFICTMFYIVE